MLAVIFSAVDMTDGQKDKLEQLYRARNDI